MSGVEALAERRPAKASTPIPKHYLKDYSNELTQIFTN